MDLRRLTKPEYLCYLAIASSSRAEDIHTRVGGVIVNKDWRVLNVAFNGWKKGMAFPKKFLLDENRNEKGEHIIHCEQNLFNFYHDIPYAIGLTISPCERCVDTIIAHNIQEVYYVKEYERDKELKFKKKLDFYKIHYQQMNKYNIKNILDFMNEDRLDLEKLINV